MIHTCDMAPSFEKWIIYFCGIIRAYVWLGAFICVVPLIHTRDMTRKVRSLHVIIIHMCDMTHSSLVCVTWFVHHFYVWHDSFIICSVTWLIPHLCVTWLIPTGWRRLIGSPKLQIIFHKRAKKYRALLLKMTYKDKGSYESSPPCTRYHSCL